METNNEVKYTNSQCQRGRNVGFFINQLGRDAACGLLISRTHCCSTELKLNLIFSYNFLTIL